MVLCPTGLRLVRFAKGLKLSDLMGWWKIAPVTVAGKEFPQKHSPSTMRSAMGYYIVSQ